MNVYPILAGALLTAGLLIAASAPAAAANKALTQDQQTLAKTKYAALQELRDRLAQELAAEFPNKSRVSVYIDLAVRGYVLESVALRVDLDAPVTRRYSETQARALLLGGADRVLRLNLEPGQHRLQIEYKGYLDRPGKKNLALDDSLALDINTTAGAQAFILPIAPTFLRPIRTLSQKGEREKWNWKAEVADPRLDVVRFLQATGDNTGALLELLRVAGPSDETDAPPRGFNALMCQVFVRMGMRAQAIRSVLAAQREGSDADVMAKLWLQIAKLDYQRGHYSEAERVIGYVPTQATPEQKAQLLDLKARILIAQNRYPQATAVLRQAIQDPAGKSQETPRLQYNLGIALLKGGNTAEGREALNRLGQRNDVQDSLRDQANLVLGYYLLDINDNASAKSVLQRLPLSSPFANRALLGLGWAQLSLSGSNAKNEQPAIERALAAWRSLAKRDPIDPAVQEALIAMPYAIEQLGQIDATLREYQQAVTKYERVNTKLEKQAQALRQGALTSAILNNDAAAIPHTGTMEQVYTSHRFQVHAQNYRDLKMLHALLQQHGGSSRMQSELTQSAEQEIQYAQQKLAQVIDAQLENLRLYQINARLGLLRNYKRDENAPIQRATPQTLAQ